MKVLREAFSIVAGILLIMGVVSKAVTANTIYDIETDKHYASETRKILKGQEKQLQERLAQARREGDIVAESECEMMLDAIRLIDERVNPVAIARQVDQTKAAFLEDEWNKFKAETVIGIAGYGASRIGFGKVTGTYMKGESWPPRSNFLTYDPLTQEKVRIILGNRPKLTAVTFSDDIADLGGMIFEIFDGLRSGRKQDAQQMSAYEGWKFTTEHLQQLQGMRPLPKDLGAYIAISMARQGIQEGSHITEQDKREDFARNWACERLRKIAIEQQTRTATERDRSEALWVAVRILCDPADIAADDAKQDPVTEEVKEETSAEKTGIGSYDGYYEGIIKDSKTGDVLDGKAVLEVSGNTVTVAVDYTVRFTAIFAKDGTPVCTATLSPIRKGEGRFANPLSMELVLEAYALQVEGEGCGNYKERYYKDVVIGSTTTLTGTFMDENNFEGRFLNLDLIVSKK